MAELINEIISPEAFKQVADMKAELASLTKQMENLLKTINASSSTTQNSGLAGVTQQTQQYNEDAKQLAKIQKEIAVAVARLNALRKDEGVQLAEAKEKLRQHTAELKNNARETLAADGSLDQMRANLNRLEKAYTALSAVARQGEIGKAIFAEFTKAKEGVTLLEQSMGNYKRNVGNYTNATFQLTQVLREMPAFAYSAQTGIMAISNNLPMLADGFKKVKEETGSTSKALAIFGKSIFSFANVFSIGIGLFALFAPAIIGFIKGTNDATKALEAQKKAFDDVLNAGSRELTNLESLYRMTTDVNVAYETRVKAAKELQKIYPEHFGNLKTEAILAGNVGDAYKTLNEELIKNTIYNAFKAQADEMAKALPALYKQLNDVNKQIEETTKKGVAGLTSVSTFSSGVPMEVGTAAESQLALTQKRIEGQINTIKKGVTEVFAVANQFATGVGFQPETPETPRKGKPTKNTKERIEEIKQEKFDEFKMTLQLLDEFHQRELFAIEEQEAKKQITTETAQRLTAKRQIQYLNELIVAYSDYAHSTEKLEVDRLKKINDFNEKAAKENLDIIKGNLDSMQQMWDNADKERYKQMQDIILRIQMAQDILNGIGDVASNLIDSQIQNIDVKQKRMEEYYDAEYSALEQLTLSDEERSKRKSALDAQKRAQEKRFENERNQALLKQARIQKQFSISDIILKTAQAIMAALAENNVPLAIANGITGAAQLATAISTPLPQFAKGTDNAPEGFAVVGERGTELVVNPDGTSWLTPAKDTITYLKKGAKVVPNNELMDMVKYANYVNVGGIKQGETGGLFGMALVAKFDELTDKVDGLTRIMAGKNMSVNIQGNYDHYLHVRKNIR